MDALDQNIEHARRCRGQAKPYGGIMPSAIVSPAPASIHSAELLLARAPGAQGFRAPDNHQSKRARQPDFAEQKSSRKRRRFTLFATHKKLHQESTLYWIDEDALEVNVRRERFLFPHFKPIVINPNATWAGSVRLPRTIERIGLKYSSHIYVVTSCFLMLTGLFIILYEYDIAFAMSMGVLPIFFLQVLAQPTIVTLCFTSFMPCYIIFCQTALIIIVSILYDNTYANIATASIGYHSSVAIFFDAMPMTVRSKVYAMLPVYILICVSGSIKMLLDQTAPDSSQDANIQIQGLRESLASRAASFSVNVAIFGVHIFVSVWRRPAALASVPAQMRVIKAVPRSLSRIVAQIHAMQAWERRARQSDISYKNSFRDPGACGQSELVRVLLSTVVPVLINSRESIGASLFGKRIGNLPFLLHKHVPGYPVLGPLIMFAAFAVLAWALFPQERVSKKHWIPVVVLVGWSSLATVPLANLRLCRLLLADFETQMFFAIKTICIALMASMHSWEANLILFSALAFLYNSIISDAWPTFIVQGRKRAYGHGLNLMLVSALYAGSRLDILLDGINEERNHRISFAGKIHIEVKGITESLLLMIAVFTLRCLILSLVRPDCCVILKAPVVSIIMPREELTRYELLYKEAVRKARHSDQVANKDDIAPIQSDSKSLTETTKAKEQMEQRFASLQEQD